MNLEITTVANLHNQILNISERVKLLEERLEQVIINISKERAEKIFEDYDKECKESFNGYTKNIAEFTTIFGSYSFLDCASPSEKVGKISAGIKNSLAEDINNSTKYARNTTDFYNK